jgi:hypothetical protein
MTELEVFKQSLDVSRLTLVVSLIVSTASIAFASLEMAFQRSHNVRSVRPLCELSAKADEGRVAIVLRNVGLGPLILYRLSLGHMDEKRRQPVPGEDDASRNAALIGLPEEGLAIPPLERREILSFSEEEEEDFRDLGLWAEYRDIYGRKHETTVKLASLSLLA